MCDIKQTGRLALDTTRGQGSACDRFKRNIRNIPTHCSFPQRKYWVRFFAFVKNLFRYRRVCASTAVRRTAKGLHYFPIDCRCKFDFVFVILFIVCSVAADLPILLTHFPRSNGDLSLSSHFSWTIFHIVELFGYTLQNVGAKKGMKQVWANPISIKCYVKSIDSSIFWFSISDFFSLFSDARWHIHRATENRTAKETHWKIDR